MSFWDRYLAPGDLRPLKQQSDASTTPPSAPPDDEAPLAPTIPTRIDAAHRVRRQNAVFFGGLAFTALAAIVTRRALRKKHLAMYPHLKQLQPRGKGVASGLPQFTPSNTPAKAEGGLDAAEALFLATLNVGAIFMAATGAAMKYFDIADTEDLRDFVRSGIGYDVYSGDSEADKEIEQWIAEVLSRKDGTGNLQNTILEKMAELAEIEKQRKLKGADGKASESTQQNRKVLGESAERPK